MRRSIVPDKCTESKNTSDATPAKKVRGVHSFGAESRLKRKIDIERCQKGGAKLHAKHFLILVTSSTASHSRLATAVTTKLEKRSVVRNKIKRRIREVFRRAYGDFKRPIDIVVVARRGVQSCEYPDYQREILGALRANGYIA